MNNINNNFPILLADYNDLPEILQLQYLAFQGEAKRINMPNLPPLQQTLEDLQDEFSNKGFIFYKMLDNSDQHKIISSVRIHFDNSKTIFINKIITHPNLWGQGLASKLLQFIEQKHKNKYNRLELFTSEISHSNINFYQKNGFNIYQSKQYNEKIKLIFLEKYF